MSENGSVDDVLDLFSCVFALSASFAFEWNCLASADSSSLGQCDLSFDINILSCFSFSFIFNFCRLLCSGSANLLASCSSIDESFDSSDSSAFSELLPNSLVWIFGLERPEERRDEERRLEERRSEGRRSEASISAEGSSVEGFSVDGFSALSAEALWSEGFPPKGLSPEGLSQEDRPTEGLSSAAPKVRSEGLSEVLSKVLSEVPSEVFSEGRLEKTRSAGRFLPGPTALSSDLELAFRL